MPTPVELSRTLVRSFIGGAAGVEEDEAGLIPWRLDPELAPFYRPEIRSAAQRASGIHLKFQSAASGFRLKFDIGIIRENQVLFSPFPHPELSGEEFNFDIFVDGRHIETQPGQGDGCYLLEICELGEAVHEITVYLPIHASIRIRSLMVFGSASAVSLPPRPRWITHGSSITYCRRATGPAFTWPAIVSRRKAWDFWNLGFGGQCKFDPVVARVIARMPADRISLCLGINTHQGFYNLQTWVPVVEGFLMGVRDGHPTTPLLVISPILSPPREERDEPPTVIGLRTMRSALSSIVSKFREAGDKHIYYLDGTKIIGPGDEGTMPDQLHPDADGIKLMARRFLEVTPLEWQA